MKQRLKSLRFRMVLPVVAMTLFVVILLTTLFSRAYTGMILKQEKEVNNVGFESVSRSLAPMIESSANAVRSILADDRVSACARNRYDSQAERIRARIRCRDYLRGEISRHDGIFGLLFMRKDGSLFGTLPDANLFLDNPEENPLPADTVNRILETPLGRTVWIGPVTGETLYGFRNAKTPGNIMIAAWKTVDASYGECYSMMLMDETVFSGLFTALEDGNSTWYLFAEDRTEIYHTGQDTDPHTETDRLFSESNSGEVFTDEEGRAVSAFSMTMESPAWTLVRVISMEKYEKVISGVRGSVALLAGVIFLAALALYELWLKKYMRQFRTLLKGITEMGQSASEPITSRPSSITEFETMQNEINRTSLALNRQMDTIARMTAEQERISTEMNLARDIQASALPNSFPAFPGRREFDLYASMTPAREVGGDFYDFFLVDEDHLALVIADVSGKGIPAALFMMTAKSLIRDQMKAGRDPAAALESVNAQLSDGNTSMMFVTVWLAVVEISTGKGLACNAGHEHPAVRQAGCGFELLRYGHDRFVGPWKKACYHNRPFELHTGDCIFVYTDGVPEAINAAGDMFKEEQITEVLNRNPDAEPEQLVRDVLGAVNQFAAGADQFDDITMLCLKYSGPKKPAGKTAEEGEHYSPQD